MRSLTRKLESVEQEIENLEARIEDWDKKLADSSSYMELMKDRFLLHREAKEELSSKMNLWEEIQIKKDLQTLVALLIALERCSTKACSSSSCRSNAC